MSERDHFFMARALRLARKGLYSTHPNPRVGCVIVRDGEIVGEGWHARAGEPHAEVHALRQAGERARGATAYVTLEPCSHHGRTPPCADALVAAGVGRVVAAMQDPNPQVAGRGLLRLANAGIEVLSGVLEAEARALNVGFIKRMESGLPYVRAKLAMSLDGRTAMASGESQWITGPEARAAVQRLRARASVIITGADTVLTDQARLTVRAEELGLNAELTALAIDRPPLRVLVDEGMIENAAAQGVRFIDGLRSIRANTVREVRGRGLMLAVELHPEAGPARRYCELLREHGILAKDTHDHTIRVAPPLVITGDQVDWALEQIGAVLTQDLT